MNIAVSTQALAKKLKLVEKIVAPKTILPILSNVLIHAEMGELHLSSTNTELTASVSCPATVTTPGRLTAPVKPLLDIVSQISDEQTHIFIEKAHVRIAAGAFKSRLQTLPVEDFPTMPVMPENGVLIPGDTFRAMIKKVRSAISDADKRYFMNGALFSLTEKALALVTTDGKRLALTTAPRSIAGQTLQVVIPTKMLDVLLSDEGHEDLMFALGERQMFFMSEDNVLSSRLVEGNFPNYQRIIPRENTHVITVPRIQLLSALKRVSLTAGDTRALSMLVETNALSLSCASAQLGDAIEHVGVTYTGPSMKIAIDWTLLSEFLESSVNQTVSIALKDPNTAALLTDGADYINVIMLMRN